MEKIATVLEMGTAKIKTGKNEGKTYWKPKVELAEGGKSFTVNIFEPKLGEALEPGKTYRLDMEKDDKGYWQIKSILGETEKPASKTIPTASGDFPPPDARGVSIERQVALKAAIEMAALDTEKVAVTEVLQMASAFADWLRGMPSTATEKPATAPVKPRVAPDVAQLIDDINQYRVDLGLEAVSKWRAWLTENGFESKSPTQRTLQELIAIAEKMNNQIQATALVDMGQEEAR